MGWKRSQQFPNSLDLVTHILEKSSRPLYNHAPNTCVAIVASIFQAVVFRIIILNLVFHERVLTVSLGGEPVLQ